MSEYIATYKAAQQISPDDFDVFHPTLKITDKTTIAEIKAWYRKANKVCLMEIRINELEELKGKEEAE